MGALWFILFIAILNFWLGYALAVKLGFALPPRQGVWAAFMASMGLAKPKSDEKATQKGKSESGPTGSGESSGWPVQEVLLPPDWEKEDQAQQPDEPGGDGVAAEAAEPGAAPTGEAGV